MSFDNIERLSPRSAFGSSPDEKVKALLFDAKANGANVWRKIWTVNEVLMCCTFYALFSEDLKCTVHVSTQFRHRLKMYVLVHLAIYID